ncbi:MAG TPA: AI-2E family transporter [Candidatus Angelobacter sp.]|nr:AI-2E family transporter [Candidatus Angelobacter sp.]
MADVLASLHRHRQALFALAMITVVAWLLWSARGALPAFFIGLALVFVLDPGVTFLARRGVPRWAGVVITYVALVAVVYGLVAYVLPPINRQAREFVEQLPELGAAVFEIEQSIERWYRGLPLPAELRTMIDEQIRGTGETIADILRGLVAPTITALVGAATFLLGLIVVPVWLFFVLKDREGFSRSVAGAMPPPWRADTENLIALLGRVGGRWVRGQLLLGLSIFIATVIGLTALTVAGFTEFGQFTLILALIAGVLEWFPIIGPIIAAIPAILIGFTIGLPAALAAAILYTAIQQLENHILVPKVMGDAVELHPAVLIVSLIVGGALFGIGGAILAAPTVAAGRDLYRYGFQRFGGLPPAEAFALVTRSKRSPVEPEPPGTPDASEGTGAEAPGEPMSEEPLAR